MWLRGGRGGRGGLGSRGCRRRPRLIDGGRSVVAVDGGDDGGWEGREGGRMRGKGWVLRRRTVRRPRLIEPTNLQMAIVERDMVWACPDSFQTAVRGGRCWLVVWRDGSL